MRAMSDLPPAPPETDAARHPGGVPESTDPDGISLDQLNQAFTEMLRTGQAPPVETGSGDAADALGGPGPLGDAADQDLRDINPRNLLEAMLFLGHPSGQPLTKEQVTSIIRGVLPSDVDELVAQLNECYAEDGSPYEIVGRGAGYQLVLRPAYESIRDRFYGRIRQARLSQAAVEVLAVVAHLQPVTAEQVNDVRGTSSGRVLAQLVRRQLIRLERQEAAPRCPVYRTTDRFLHLFGLESLDDLPRSEELDSR